MRAAVLSQTYIMPVGVKKLEVTQSVHGITTRNILVALANDQVCVIPCDAPSCCLRRVRGQMQGDEHARCVAKCCGICRCHRVAEQEAREKRAV